MPPSETTVVRHTPSPNDVAWLCDNGLRSAAPDLRSTIFQTVRLSMGECWEAEDDLGAFLRKKIVFVNGCRAMGWLCEIIATVIRRASSVAVIVIDGVRKTFTETGWATVLFREDVAAAGERHGCRSAKLFAKTQSLQPDRGRLFGTVDFGEGSGSMAYDTWSRLCKVANCIIAVLKFKASGKLAVESNERFMGHLGTFIIAADLTTVAHISNSQSYGISPLQSLLSLLPERRFRNFYSTVRIVLELALDTENPRTQLDGVQHCLMGVVDKLEKLGVPGLTHDQPPDIVYAQIGRLYKMFADSLRSPRLDPRLLGGIFGVFSYFEVSLGEDMRYGAWRQFGGSASDWVRVPAELPERGPRAETESLQQSMRTGTQFASIVMYREFWKQYVLFVEKPSGAPQSNLPKKNIAMSILLACLNGAGPDDVQIFQEAIGSPRLLEWLGVEPVVNNEWRVAWVVHACRLSYIDVRKPSAHERRRADIVNLAIATWPGLLKKSMEKIKSAEYRSRHGRDRVNYSFRYLHARGVEVGLVESLAGPAVVFNAFYRIARSVEQVTTTRAGAGLKPKVMETFIVVWCQPEEKGEENDFSRARADVVVVHVVYRRDKFPEARFFEEGPGGQVTAALLERGSRATTNFVLPHGQTCQSYLGKPLGPAFFMPVVVFKQKVDPTWTGSLRQGEAFIRSAMDGPLVSRRPIFSSLSRLTYQCRPPNPDKFFASVLAFLVAMRRTRRPRATQLAHMPPELEGCILGFLCIDDFVTVTPKQRASMTRSMAIACPGRMDYIPT